MTILRSTGVDLRRGLWRAASIACGLGVGLELVLAWPLLWPGRAGHTALLQPTTGLFFFLLCLGTIGWRRSRNCSWARSAIGQLGVVAAGLAAGVLGFASQPWQVPRLVSVLALVLTAGGLARVGDAPTGAATRLPWWSQTLRIVAMGAAGFVGAILLLTALQVVRWLLDGGEPFHPRWHVLLRGAVALAVLVLVPRLAAMSRRETLALLGSGLVAFPLAELGFGPASLVYMAARGHSRIAWLQLHHLWAQNTAVYLMLGFVGFGIVTMAGAPSRQNSAAA